MGVCHSRPRPRFLVKRNGRWHYSSKRRHHSPSTTRRQYRGGLFSCPPCPTSRCANPHSPPLGGFASLYLSSRASDSDPDNPPPYSCCPQHEALATDDSCPRIRARAASCGDGRSERYDTVVIEPNGRQGSHASHGKSRRQSGSS